MSDKTACPLDCFDVCSVVVRDGRLYGDRENAYTHGYLCAHLNHYDKHERITQPRYKGKNISMDEAVQTLQEKLRACVPSKVLHYRGSGNFALMQQVTDHFFSAYGAALTKGSVCDGAGNAAMEAGRGKNLALSPEQIGKAEVVILWGRNVHTSSSHLLPFLKDKTIIVIDPIRTRSAEHADLFVQIKPHGDLLLALMLARFVMIEGFEDKVFLEKYTEDHEDFFDLTQTVRIKAALEQIDMTLGQLGDILKLIQGRRTVILTGASVQKYQDGTDVVRAIDAFGVVLGLLGKEGCGVSTLGSSMEGIESPFAIKNRVEQKATADFSKYDMVFVQAANPLNQMPDTTRVTRGLEAVATVVYFGLYENETSQMADLVIPAKSFLEKNDIRTSYGHDGLLSMPKVRDSDIGISEYALAHKLCEVFDIAIQSEAEYLEHFASHGEEREGMMKLKGREQPPYKSGFYTDEGKFVFPEEVDFDFNMADDLFLLTCKSETGLNSQFHRQRNVYLSPALGFIEGARLRIVSANGSLELDVVHDIRLRSDCVLIYSGTPGVNHLTPSRLSYEGDCAVYQDNKVKVELC